MIARLGRPMRWLLALGALLIIVGAVRYLVQAPTGQVIVQHDALGNSFEPSEPGLIGATTALGFILLGAWITGLLFRQIELPKLSGYLLFGVLVGPSLTRLLGIDLPALLPQGQLRHLALVNSLAIAFIALTAGGEIRIDFLRSGFKRIATITGIEVVTVLVGVTITLWLLSPMMGFLREEPALTVFFICLIIGVLEVANSPAVVIAILGETRAKGQLAQLALAITIFKDLLLIILFTIVLAVAVNAIGQDGATAGAGEIAQYLAVHLVGSIVAGIVLGFGLARVVHHTGDHVTLFVLAVALGIALVSEALGLETLLVALAAGFTMVNLWPERSAPFFHQIERLALPVYCLFFAIAGAKIELSKLMQYWPLALTIVGVRLAMVYGGTWLGATVAGLRGTPRRWLWTALVPQAGVTIALIASIEQSFAGQEWVMTLTSVLLAVVAIHEVAGPMLFRFGLHRAGEIADSPRP